MNTPPVSIRHCYMPLETELGYFFHLAVPNGVVNLSIEIDILNVKAEGFVQIFPTAFTLTN